MSTNQLSPERVQRSRNMQSDILHAVAETKQVNVAKCLGVDSSTVGRWLDSKNPESQVVRFCDMLALCGLKIVPANAKHYDAEKIAILFRVAKYHFQNLEEVDDFFENDAGMSESSDIRYSRVNDLSQINTTSNIVFALLARCIEACKNLLIIKKDGSELITLTTKQAIENERQQERQDIVADQAAFWKLVYILFHIAGVAFVLFTLIHFWGK